MQIPHDTTVTAEVCTFLHSGLLGQAHAGLRDADVEHRLKRAGELAKFAQKGGPLHKPKLAPPPKLSAEVRLRFRSIAIAKSYPPTTSFLMQVSHSDEYFRVQIGVGAAESEPLKVCADFTKPGDAEIMS